MRTLVIAGLGAVVLGLGGAAWYFGWVPPLSSAENPAPAASAESRPAPARCGQSEGAKCVEYRSDAYKFSVFHSDKQTVRVVDEGAGASTIVFENLDDVRGFQIFVVPYGFEQVQEDRFKQDLPSGVREGLENITVDGATGAAFYSSDAALGETREVWFIKNGYLYEVTTLKSLEDRLLEIMQTWKFF